MRDTQDAENDTVYTPWKASNHLSERTVLLSGRNSRLSYIKKKVEIT